MIGSVLLNEIILLDGEVRTQKILDRMRLQIIHSLNQKGIIGQSQDGMDMTLCRYDKKKSEVLFTGANHTLILIRNEELILHKGDGRPVGYYKGENIPFTETKIDIIEGDRLYLFSDGYQDQFGGKNDKKFKISNLRKLFLSIHQKPMDEQKNILDDNLLSWMGKSEQIDDVLIMGVEF
jgi:serine phosphatase RsbU (regulator of sigma subunit)